MVPTRIHHRTLPIVGGREAVGPFLPPKAQMHAAAGGGRRRGIQAKGCGSLGGTGRARAASGRGAQGKGREAPAASSQKCRTQAKAATDVAAFALCAPLVRHARAGCGAAGLPAPEGRGQGPRRGTGDPGRASRFWGRG